MNGKRKRNGLRLERDESTCLTIFFLLSHHDNGSLPRVPVDYGGYLISGRSMLGTAGEAIL